MMQTLQKTILQLALGALLLLTAAFGNAQVTVGNLDTGTATYTNVPTGVSFSNFSKGSSVGNASAQDGLNGSGFNTASPEASYSGNKYYSVSITAASTHTATLTGITWLTALSGTASGTKFTVKYSNNGGTLTNFGVASQGGTTTNTFTGSVTIAAGKTLVLYFLPSNASQGTGTVRFKNNSSFTLTTALATTAPTVSTTQIVQANITATGATAGGNVSADGGASVTARGVVWNTSASPTIALSTKTSNGTGTGSFTSSLSSLSPNTRYYYRAYATNSVNTSYGTEYSFYTLALTPAAPTVSAPTTTSLDVSINANGNNANTQYAIRVNGSQYLNASGNLQATEVWRTAAQWATTTVTLSAGTTYSFDVKARNGANVETPFGPAAEGTTTSATAPHLTLVDTLLDFDTVCTNDSSLGYFIFSGANLTANASIVVFPLSGFSYSLTETGPYTSSLSVENYNGGEIMVYVKFAPDAVNVYDGSILVVGQGDDSAAQLTIPATGEGVNTPAIVITSASGVSALSSTGATLRGQATPGGCTEITSYGFVYSTTNGFSTGTIFPANNLTSDNFTATLTSLLPGTTYYYKAYAVDNNGATITYGGQQQFTTLGIGTPVATSATDVTQTSFTANWTAVPGATSYRLDVSSHANFATGSPATELFISEYVEGTPGNQKAIELFNGTATAIDLSAYSIMTQANGASAWTSERHLAGTVAAGDVFVIAGGDSSTVSEISSAADLFLTYSSGTGGNPDNRAMFFTGNDAIGLFKNGVLIDVVGISTAETTESGTWGTDKVAVRNAPVSAPSPSFDASQWTKVSYATNAIQLGSHTFDGASVPDFIAEYNNREVSGTTHTLTGLDPFTTYYYRVRAYSQNSTSGNSNIINLTTKPAIVTWNGTAWSPALYPDAAPVVIDTTMDVVIAGNFSTEANGIFTAKNIIIDSGTFVVSPNTTLTVGNAIVNNLSADHFVVENNGNLLQNTASSNTTAITVKRDSSPLYRQDYSLWSSPVDGQNLLAFSPSTLSNRFYTYNTLTDQYTYANTAGAFDAGKGYLIRMPNGGKDNAGHPTGTTADWIAYEGGAETMVFNGVFAGIPHNGNLTVTLSEAGNGYNAVGNPYPSPILISAFREANQNVIDGTVWVWRKKNASTNSAYCTVNSVGIYTSNNAPEQEDPNNVIRTGQGFIVKLKPGHTSADLVFNNGMRTNDTSNQFFRMSGGNNNGLPEAHGIWLNLTNANGFFSQMYTGYIAGATQGVDYGIDSKYINDNATVLANAINDADYIIQGRSLPFSAEDVVPLRFKAAAAGSFSIAIDHVNGLFAEGQDIFLKDNLTGALHNLNSGSYTFTTQAGSFANRFEIVYTDAALGTAPAADASGVMVYRDAAGISVAGGTEMLKDVAVYDVRGRLLLENRNINAYTTTLSSLVAENQVLIVKVTLANGASASRKVAF